MLYSNEIRTVADDTDGAGKDDESIIRPVLGSARVLPTWAAALSSAFSVGAGLCLIGVAILAVFFQSLVAEQSQGLLAVLLLVVGGVPVLGALLLDYAHIRALSGYRALREAQSRKAGAILAALAAVALAMLHPILCLGVVAAAVLGEIGGRLLARRGIVEPLWDATPSEAASILAGRDAVGYRLAAAKPDSHAVEAPMHRALQWAAILITLAGASFLAGIGHLTTAAVPGVVLIALWASGALAEYLLARRRPGHVFGGLTHGVDHVTPEQCDMSAGLQVDGLSVTLPGGKILLSEVNLAIEPGTILGVTGPSGSGKSLFLKALGSPFDLDGLDLRGRATINGQDLWHRSAETAALPVVHLPAQPLILPTRGQDNLTCFHGDVALEQGRNILSQLIFDSYAVDRVCKIADATHLPSMHQKALSLARAFVLTPDLYLMDRPEDGLSQSVVDSLILRLAQERRMGRTVIMVTENRALLEACDQMIVIEDGRVVDFGDAREINSKSFAGWASFTGQRMLETEDNLVLWVRNQFKRPGDDTNRRNISQIAAEMLAFSCQSVSRANEQTLTFELKKVKGHCLVRMIDDDPVLSSGKLERARLEVEQSKGIGKLSPLAEILRGSESVDATVERNRRVLRAEIAIHDPRLTGEATAR